MSRFQQRSQDDLKGQETKTKQMKKYQNSQYEKTKQTSAPD